MKNTRVWNTVIRGANDGTGDGILELPDDLFATIGWKEGDSIDLSCAENGEVILSRVEIKTAPDQGIRKRNNSPTVNVEKLRQLLDKRHGEPAMFWRDQFALVC